MILSLISTGIDSPIATYLMLRKGINAILLNFYRDRDELDRLLEIAKVLSNYGRIEKILVAEHSKIFTRNFGRYSCIYCKISMLKVAEKICNEFRCHAIVTGDNLGQVASQTLDNMLVVSKATKIPIIRPLIGFDKEEIVNIAKEIGTYEISIKSQKKCPFLPKNPATSAKPDKIDFSIEVDVDVEELNFQQQIHKP